MIEKDRFSYNKPLYFIGMLSMIGAIVLLFLSLYTLPYLMWSLNYEVFDFVTRWQFHLVAAHQYSDKFAGFVVFLGLFIPSLILGFIADLISNHIDRRLLQSELNSDPEKNNAVLKPTSHASLFQSLHILSKAVIMIIAVLALLFFMQWLISTPVQTFP